MLKLYPNKVQSTAIVVQLFTGSFCHPTLLLPSRRWLLNTGYLNSKAIPASCCFANESVQIARKKTRTREETELCERERKLNEKIRMLRIKNQQQSPEFKVVVAWQQTKILITMYKIHNSAYRHRITCFLHLHAKTAFSGNFVFDVSLAILRVIVCESGFFLYLSLSRSISRLLSSFIRGGR